MEGRLIMKVVGIITEYNPFHKGHKYHIEEAKKITGADYLVAVMSGNFVQRGSPAIINKYDRAMMALNNGVDLVLELPVCYATGSAQYFALGAVALLNQLGIVDYLCFGSECGNIKLLEDAAKLFYKSSESFDNILYSYIRKGLSYPAAREKAAKDLLKADTQIISEPNNILAIEYIRALLLLNSSIKPITIKRNKAHYHDKELKNDISSATAIRSILQNSKNPAEFSPVKNNVTNCVYDYFIKNYNRRFPITMEDFSSIIKYKLTYESNRKLTEYLDLSSDLVDRIKNIDIQNYDIESLMQIIKSKNITLTRVSRALIHILLNIKKKDFKEYIDDEIIYYGRILGMKKEASHLIRKIKEYERIPIITKVSKADKQLSSLGMSMLNQDILASHLYNQVVFEKFKISIPNEFKHGICIL
ncbi:MAG TPA: nucleotidyltransferase [Herbinix luporum]|jgi:predicted nucleotidyltransferase|nr:nucleotidyltransferase [Herbinix luporum]